MCSLAYTFVKNSLFVSMIKLWKKEGEFFVWLMF